MSDRLFRYCAALEHPMADSYCQGMPHPECYTCIADLVPARPADVFEAVAERALTPEEGSELLMEHRHGDWFWKAVGWVWCRVTRRHLLLVPEDRKCWRCGSDVARRASRREEP